MRDASTQIYWLPPLSLAGPNQWASSAMRVITALHVTMRFLFALETRFGNPGPASADNPGHFERVFLFFSHYRRFAMNASARFNRVRPRCSRLAK